MQRQCHRQIMKIHQHKFNGISSILNIFTPHPPHTRSLSLSHRLICMDLWHVKRTRTSNDNRRPYKHRKGYMKRQHMYTSRLQWTNWMRFFIAVWVWHWIWADDVIRANVFIRMNFNTHTKKKIVHAKLAGELHIHRSIVWLWLWFQNIVYNYFHNNCERCFVCCSIYIAQSVFADKRVEKHDSS